MLASNFSKFWPIPTGLFAIAVAAGCSDSGESPAPAAGGSTSSGKGGGSGTAGATAGGTTGSAGTGAMAGAGTGGNSGGTAGASGGTAGASGGSAGSGGSGGSEPTAWTPCNTPPEAQAPDVVRSDPIGGFDGMQTAGQIVGVPGEPDLLYVIGHRDGQVFVVQNGTVLDAPLVTVTVSSGGNDEQGLLSMALHPDFASNQLFYLFYTAQDGDLTIDEFTRTSPTAAAFSKNVFSTPREGGGEFHNGGSIVFNPLDDTKSLFFSAGNTSGNTAGDLEGTVGRVLRIDVSTQTYETYARGLRNPYRMSVDRLTGILYISDVANGQGGTVILNDNEPGADYLYRDNNGSPDVNDGVHRETGGRAIIGGFVYRGHNIPGACGRYFYGLHNNEDSGAGIIKSFVVDALGNAADFATHFEVPGRLTSLGEDGEGELYVASMNNQIFKIEAAQ